MSTSLRPPLPGYERDASTALRTVQPTDASSDLLANRRGVWAAYLGAAAAPPHGVPLATRWLQIVVDAADADGTLGDLVPGSFYPAGFRNQVLAGCGLTSDPVGDAMSRDGTGLGRLLHAVSAPSASSTRTLTLAALALNLLSRYGDVVARLAVEASQRRDPQLWSEVARARYAASLSSDAAAEHFAQVATSMDWAPRARVGAAIRLVAHCCRSAHDVEAAGRWVDVAVRLVDEHDDGGDGWLLYRSHLDRARALYDWRRHDANAMWSHLSSARAAAHALQTGTTSTVSAALHAERLVLEAELKAFLGRPAAADPARAAAAARRIVEIDPMDPYSNLAAGDTAWVLGEDEEAVRRLARAVEAGTLAGALAARRLTRALEMLGRGAEVPRWDAAARDLDEAAA